MGIDRSKAVQIPYSTTHIDNFGFDAEYQLPVVENLVYNPATGTMDRMTQAPMGTGIPQYDYLQKVATDATTDTITYKTGGASGTTVATLVMVYTDSTKTDISTITKT